MTGSTSTGGSTSDAPTGGGSSDTAGTGAPQAFGPPSTNPGGGGVDENGNYYQLGVTAINPVPVGGDPTVPGSGVLEGNFLIQRDPLDTNLSIGLEVYYQLSGSLQEGVDYRILDPNPGPTFDGWNTTAIVSGSEDVSIGVDVLENPGLVGGGELTLKAFAWEDFYGGSPAYPGDPTATMEIPATTFVSVGTAAAETSEGSGIPASFSVALGQPLGYDLTIPLQISGTAFAGLDYETIGTIEDSKATPPVYDTSVTIPAGQTQASIPVVPLDDATQLGDRSVIASLGPNSKLFAPGSSSDATVTLHDGKPDVSIVADRPSATQGDGSTGDFTVSRTGSTVQPLLVAYAVGGTAVAGVDYSPLSGSVVIAAGSFSAAIPIVPIG